MLASHIRVLVQVLATLVLFQLPANGPRKTLEDGPSTWLPVNHVGDQDGCLVPGFNLAQTWLLQPSGEGTDGFCLFISLC